MRASIRGDNVGSLNETGLNGCFCTRDIGAITEGVIEKLKRVYIFTVCTVMTRLIGFLFLFENGLFDYSIKRIYEKFMEVLHVLFIFRDRRF